MKIAFVGNSKRYSELEPGYRHLYDRFHLELPYYYARHGMNDVVIITPDHSSATGFTDSPGMLSCSEGRFPDGWKPDVVVHWRRWVPEFYVPGAVNVINCQDHSFSLEWKRLVWSAWDMGQLHGILCFPTWHERNLRAELRRSGQDDLSEVRTIPGLTLGVDTDIYCPFPEKDPYRMLWASDPGRGISSAAVLAMDLWRRDRRFTLDVCAPDYSPLTLSMGHPAVVSRGNLKNGPELWRLFNSATFLPYTSTFMEPSSRAHRQAMSAGCIVLYPPGMGSPSELIRDGRDGFVRDPSAWADLIVSLVEDKTTRLSIQSAARDRAIQESWRIQAARFYEYFEGEIGRC